MAPDGIPFELPLEGAIGFAAVKTQMQPYEDYDPGVLKAGQFFRIVADEGETWVVQSGKYTGRVVAAQQLVNLPDIIPSIVYNDTNARASIFASSGKALAGITGERLYEVLAHNDRLDAEEFYMPVRYPMAAKIMTAQQAALANGETLIIYETFRPRDVQQAVDKALTKLYKSNKTVKKGIDKGGYGLSDFVATDLSRHQLGVAIDVTLGAITEDSLREGNEWTFRDPVAQEIEMQTPMHELSAASVSMARPTSTKNGSQKWRDVPAAKTMTADAIRLRDYCVAAGLTPVSSQWWHFDDWDAYQQVPEGDVGAYRLTLPFT
jgi:D-alanyl-D-alanine dipeptidase